MPLIIGAIVVIGVIYLLFLLVVYVIIPISGFAIVAALVVGAIYAFGISMYSFCKSLKNNINPYNTYEDKSKNAPNGIRRSYFFGPGYHQIAQTVGNTFSNMSNHINVLTNWKDGKSGDSWYIIVWVWIFYLMACLCTYVLGFAYAAVFSIILTSIIFVGMGIFYILFSLLWLMDRTTLLINSIYSRCGTCKKISIVPIFICPNCRKEHSNLTPGPYGIFYRKCSCKKYLPSTFFNGRSKLEASCPFCAAELAVSGAHHFGIQLVGGSNAGKTTFLAAFWHLYLEKLKISKKTDYEEFPADAFNVLEQYYQQGRCESTSEHNAKMYSVVHKRGKKIPYQLTVYDIAGEAFTKLNSDRQQQQFKYCECIVFIIDPVSGASQSACESFSCFVSEFKSIKGIHDNKVSDIPIAIIISKADKYKNEIGQENAGVIGNDACQEFLEKRGFGNILNLIDVEFKKAEFFFISAMGHEQNLVKAKPYEPWGVNEVAAWIQKVTDKFMGRRRLIKFFKNIVALATLCIFIAAVTFFAVQIAVPAIRTTITNVTTWVQQASHDVLWYTENPDATDYTISTAEEMAKLSKIVNGTWKKKQKKDNFAGKTITLAGNIDLSQYKNWVPIGSDSVNVFSGNFNGGGHVISNLTINNPNTDRQGLFGHIANGNVQNLGLEGVNIRGRYHVGSVAGTVNKGSKVNKCYSTGIVYGRDDVGGIAGRVFDSSIVSNSYSSVAVNGNNWVGGVAGGVGRNSTVVNSYFSGTVSGDEDIGGVVAGVFASTVVGSYSTGTVSGTSKVGGVAGSLAGNSSVSNSYSIGAVSGVTYVGGVAGVVGNSKVTNSYSAGTIRGTNWVGGVAGNVSVAGGAGMKSEVISNAALNPEIRGTGPYVGRVVGSINAGTLSKNVAHAEIKNRTGNTKWVNRGSATINGADISAATIKRDGTIGRRFTAANGWTVQNGSLPKIIPQPP